MDGPRGKSEIAAESAPSDDERSELQNRREVLRSALRASDFDAVKRRIAKLFGLGLASQDKLDADSARDLVSDYANVLKSQPLWAVDAACVAVIERGDRFRPSAPELLAIAKSRSAHFFAEAHRIERVLGATVLPPPDPNRRRAFIADIRAKFPDLLSPMRVPGRPHVPGEPRVVDPNAEARLESLVAHYRATPVQFSPLARRAMGMAPEKTPDLDVSGVPDDVPLAADPDDAGIPT